jgi:hypothetical protein
MRLAAARRLVDDPALAPEHEAAVIAGLLSAEFGAGLIDALSLAVEEPTPPVTDPAGPGDAASGGRRPRCSRWSAFTA